MTRFDDFVSSFTHLISSHPFTSEKREEEEEEEEERGLELEREFLREGAVILEKLVSFLPHNSHPPGIDWLPEEYRKEKKGGYQQYLLYLDPDERFSVVSFVWGPSQFTPIHDHGTWGMIGQLQGSESETSFKFTENKFGPFGTPAKANLGDVATVVTSDIHLVRNEVDGVSISIHVYGSNIGTTRRSTYDPESGKQTEFISGYSPGPPPLRFFDPSPPSSSLSLSSPSPPKIQKHSPTAVYQMIYDVIGTILSLSSEKKKEKKDAPSMKEFALIDVREKERHQEEHPLYAVCVPYSVFESFVVGLVPSFTTDIVIMDDGDGEDALSVCCASILIQMGYKNVSIMEGGMREWREKGLEVFSGCGVPSKAFGEHVAETGHTPMLSAHQVQERIKTQSDKTIILDSRPFSEYHRMSIPTGQFCGGGELVYKYFEVVERKKSEKRGEEEEITVIVNCAGRTRSIVGTQSLVNALKEERKEGGEESGDERRKMNVFACENGTMGWVLAGLELEHQQKRTTPPPSKENLFLSQKAVERVVERFGVKRCEWEDVLRWKEEQGNGSGPSLFLFDVRLEDEFEKGHLPGSRHAPGGQLVQAYDEYVGGLGSIVVLIDNGERVRAEMTASWLVQLGMGHVFVLKGGIQAHGAPPLVSSSLPSLSCPSSIAKITEISLNIWIQSLSSSLSILDCSKSSDYSKSHLPGSFWISRPFLFSSSLSPSSPSSPSPLPSSCLLSGTLSPFPSSDVYVLVDREKGKRTSIIAKEMREYLDRVFGVGVKRLFVFDGDFFALSSLSSEPGIYLSVPNDVGYRPYEHPGAQLSGMQDYLDWEAQLCSKVIKDASSAWIRT